MNSIIYVMVRGGTQEAMDKAYGKHKFAVSLIQMGGLFADSTTNALGQIGNLTGFANALINYDRANSLLRSYKSFSSVLKTNMHEMVRISNDLKWLRENTPAITDTIKDMNGLIIDAISTHR